MYSDVFGGSHPIKPISEIAMIVFSLAQTVSLFMTNNRMIVEAKAMEQKLALENE